MKKISTLSIVIILSSMIIGCANKSNYPAPKSLIESKKNEKIIVLWKKKIGNGTGKQADLKLAPCFDGKLIYSVNFNGKISAIRINNGKIYWTNQLKENLTTSPVISKNFVIVGSLDGNLIGINKDTGKTLWVKKLTSSIFGTPKVKDKVVYVQTHDGNISAHDIVSGKILWREKNSTPELILVGNSPFVIWKDLLITGTSSGKVLALNPNSGKKIWEKITSISTQSESITSQMIDIVSNPMAYDNILYIAGFQGNIISMDLEKNKIIWQKKASIYNNISLSKNLVFTCNTNDHLTAYSKKNGELIWNQNILEGRRISGPLFLKGKLFVTDYKGYIHIFNASDGKYFGYHYITSGNINAQPVTYKNYIVIQSDEGTLVVMKLK